MFYEQVDDEQYISLLDISFTAPEMLAIKLAIIAQWRGHCSVIKCCKIQIDIMTLICNISYYLPGLKHYERLPLQKNSLFSFSCLKVLLWLLCKIKSVVRAETTYTCLHSDNARPTKSQLFGIILTKRSLWKGRNHGIKNKKLWLLVIVLYLK